MSLSGDERVSPLQVKDRVYERLREALIDQVFAPGEPLREATLTELYGVSKTPIREALVRLQQDGLVEIAAYRGARASSYTEADLAEIFEAREILECECVRRAAAAPGPEIGERLAATVDSAERAIAAGDLAAGAASLDEFDEVLFEQLKNALLDEIRQRLSMHLRRVGRVNLTPESVARSLAEHRTIIAAVVAHDPDGAEEALRAHLRSVQRQQIEALGI
ncbi:GntR family transcriptional regulator [Herbiconiux moechotypicola]|uniref:GntR family transcriptional regulator n=1 Tax=Herbiconiux moechotypicola TaxID=637393 RepID=A0ABP5R1T0_9MICO|nr:GntR family transcriptional regulator [Herbiconiux moechotypicola]MCS5731582.1 GntR family transcriptional regulator [Herbiconiux moechotypicola]